MKSTFVTSSRKTTRLMRVTNPSAGATRHHHLVGQGYGRIKLENRTHAPVDFDTNVASTIISHDAGYIAKELETIVGLQTDAPLKRALIPFGGIKMVEGSCKVYGRELDPQLKKCSPNTVKPTTGRIRRLHQRHPELP